MAIHSLIDNVDETIRVFSRCKTALISKGVYPSDIATDIPSEIESIPSGFNAIPDDCFFANQLAANTGTKTFAISQKPKYILISAMQYYNGGTYKVRGWLGMIDVEADSAYRSVVSGSAYSHDTATPVSLGVSSVTNTSLVVTNPSAVVASFLVQVFY